ncbi:hypothetical protein BFL43_20410 [Williamsia sp. 1135]|nr:hypothetical protein BFL43_20410 [Williamsia sp. 1135]
MPAISVRSQTSRWPSASAWADSSIPGGRTNPDQSVDARHGRALDICRRCPVVEECARWASALPRSKSPGGVVGGIRTVSRPVGRPPTSEQQKETP